MTDLGLLKSYNYLGEEVAETGALLIGRAPHVAKLAWLHSIYPPLNDQQISELESRMQIKIPSSYVDFLHTSNGLKVFVTTFCLFGLRTNFDRSPAASRLPFDIIVPNTIERPENAPRDILIIGGYDWDGSILFMDPETQTVHLSSRERLKSKYQWKDFDTMMAEELMRLSSLFDEHGKSKTSNKSTLPKN